MTGFMHPSLLLLTLASLFGVRQAAPHAEAVPLVATHYFYWYRWPDEHMNPAADPRREGHLHQVPELESVSYLDPAWHAAQFAQMAACGIDIALPVYWGAPGAYERPSIRFSRDGLAPMVAALERLERAQQPVVKLGLFYDTSTLSNDVRGVAPRAGRADLRSEAGRRLFCETVVEFFERIPAEHWARIDGKALVVTYASGFAAGWDRTLGDSLRAAFAERFPGQQPYLVADSSWGEIGQDRTTTWGAALWGARVHDGVVQIGPGYDDSAVPGRHTPRREREQGNFYRASWRRAVAARPSLVLIETWNELHEGTEICPTRECGSLYLDITREWTARLRSGLDAGPARLGPRIELRFPEPLAQPDLSWGTEARGESKVELDYRQQPVRRHGLREVACEDGPIELRAGGLVSGSGWDGPVHYLYFQASDAWCFDARCDLRLRLCYSGSAAPLVEYDSREESATLRGAYTSATRSPVADPAADPSSEPRELSFLLPAARMAGRQNGGADLRLVLRSDDLVLHSLELERLPGER